jgi:predicted Zn finger-like uncharacterized protein
MRVSCPSCGASVSADDVNITRMVAKCRACQSVFSFEAQLQSAPVAAAPAPARELAAVMEVQREGPAPATAGDYRTAQGGVGRLRIVRRWYKPEHWGLLFFAIAWNSFLVFWISGVLSAPGGIAMALFSVAHVAVGIAITYTALTGLFNRTVIEVDAGGLSVRHGPIPAKGNRDIALSDLRQLFTVEIAGNKGVRTYELHAVVRNGPTVTIATGLSDTRQALFLERTIEDHVGIVDQPVAGEMPK